MTNTFQQKNHSHITQKVNHWTCHPPATPFTAYRAAKCASATESRAQRETQSNANATQGGRRHTTKPIGRARSLGNCEHRNGFALAWRAAWRGMRAVLACFRVLCAMLRWSSARGARKKKNNTACIVLLYTVHIYYFDSYVFIRPPSGIHYFTCCMASRDAMMEFSILIL